MAKPHPNYTAILSIFLLIISSLLLRISSSSAARLLIADTDDVYLPPKSLAATEQSMNLALPRRVLPCNTNKMAGTGFQALRLCAMPGHLLLSMLPKGGVPPSGPSRRINDINN